MINFDPRLLQRRQWLQLAGGAGLAATVPGWAQVREGTRQKLVVQGMILPGIVNADGSGSMAKFMEMLLEQIRSWNVEVEVLRPAPVARVTNAVKEGTIDLGYPTLKMGDTVLPYKVGSRSWGDVPFVLYSRKSDPITRERVLALSGQPAFGLHIEAPQLPFGFPVERFTDFERALRKIEAGRLDALLWAQTEADFELRRLGLKGIHRELFQNYASTHFFSQRESGRMADQWLAKALDELDRNGQLGALWRKVHPPYQAD